MSRAIVVLDENGHRHYTEQVPDIAQEPDYAKAWPRSRPDAGDSELAGDETRAGFGPPSFFREASTRPGQGMTIVSPGWSLWLGVMRFARQSWSTVMP